MHSVARNSSSSSLQHPYHSYHPHSSAYASTPQYLSTESLTSHTSGVGMSTESARARVEPAPAPARGCLKAPTKEFSAASDASRDGASSVKGVSHTSRRRPDMRLERLPGNAITRIQMSEGVERHEGQNATGSGTPGGKCKQRVLTPYVKSDKGAWLEEGDE